MSRLEDFIRISKAAPQPAPPKTENESAGAAQNPLTVDTSATKIGELKNAGAMTKIFLNDLFDRQNTRNESPSGNISRKAGQADLETDAEFKKLPAATQRLVRQALAKNQGNPADVDTLARLAQSAGFNRLNAAEQKHLINFVGGTNLELSQGARAELRTILDNPNADKSNPATFRKFLKEQPSLPSGVNTEPGASDARRRAYTVTGPVEEKNYDFYSGAGDAQKYTVETGGKKIPVYVGKDQDPNETYQTIDEVAKGLAALPPESLEKVTGVNVDPKLDPDDAYWEKEYNTPGLRAYMSAGADGVINIYPGRQTQHYLDGSMIHETGHTFSQQRLGVKTNNKLGDLLKHLSGKIAWSDWKSAMKKDGISPSGYARDTAAANGSPDEDFAETFQLYMEVRGKPQAAEIRAIMPERFALLDKLLKK